MTFDLSLRIKILALVGLVLAAGAAGTFVLAHNRSGSEPLAIPPTHTTPAQGAKQPVQAHAQPASTPLDANLPAPVRHALGQSKLVVAFVGTPSIAVDAEVLAEAQAGARSAHAGFVTLDVRNDTVAAATAAWMKDIFEPAVLVVTRPGTIAVELDGYADSSMVAQAVADSRP